MDLMNPWPSGGNVGARTSDIQKLIEALTKLETVEGKQDGKKCFSVKVYRNASRQDINSVLHKRSCDIIYTITHGQISDNDSNDRWMNFGGDANLSVSGYDYIARRMGCELNPYGCYIAPNRESATGGSTMIQGITSSINSRTPECCPNVKKVCLLFGPDENRGDKNVLSVPTYPESWKP